MLRCTEEGRLDFTKYDTETKWTGTASTAYRNHLMPQKNAVVAFELSARAVAKTLQAVAAAVRSYWSDIVKALIALAAALASAAAGTLGMNPASIGAGLVAAIGALAICAVYWSAAETSLTNALASATGSLRESMKDAALDGPNGSWPAHYDVDLSDGSVEVGAGGKVDGSDWSLKQ